MKKTCKSTIAILITIALLAGITSHISVAAKKPILSKKTMNIVQGESAKLTVKHGKKNAKIKWKSSKKGIAKIVRSSSKGKSGYVVIKGKRIGKVTISAIYKIGKKKIKLVCKVTVRKRDVTHVVTQEPVILTTEMPSVSPSIQPVIETSSPTEVPVEEPTKQPTEVPVEEPTKQPTEVPMEEPTRQPTEVPMEEPTKQPTEVPTEEPTRTPTEIPTQQPTKTPIPEPTATPVAEYINSLEADAEKALVDVFVIDNGVGGYNTIYVMNKEYTGSVEVTIDGYSYSNTGSVTEFLSQLMQYGYGATNSAGTISVYRKKASDSWTVEFLETGVKYKFKGYLDDTIYNSKYGLLIAEGNLLENISVR